MTKFSKAKAVAAEIVRGYRFDATMQDLLEDAYLRGRADQLEHDKQVAAEVRRKLEKGD